MSVTMAVPGEWEGGVMVALGEGPKGQRLGMSDRSGRWQQHFLVNKGNPYGGQRG